jgi:hypothetical protein
LNGGVGGGAAEAAGDGDSSDGADCSGDSGGSAAADAPLLGGELRFVPPPWDASLAAVSVGAAAGRGVLFGQDLVHEGAMVRGGVKYAMRTEVLYVRQRGAGGADAAAGGAVAAAAAAVARGGGGGSDDGGGGEVSATGGGNNSTDCLRDVKARRDRACERARHLRGEMRLAGALVSAVLALCLATFLARRSS